MNKERILDVANMIEQHTRPWLGFNMSFVVSRADTGWYRRDDHRGDTCTTIACIAGHALICMGKAVENDFATVSQTHDAATWLGLDNVEASKLFFAIDSAFEHDLTVITPEHAVTVLRHFAETGEVDWDKFAALSPDSEVDAG